MLDSIGTDAPVIPHGLIARELRDEGWDRLQGSTARSKTDDALGSDQTKRTLWALSGPQRP
jgi:hypothetical protein